jgi:hypothetical protein
VYDKLTPAEQLIARGIFLRLTELGEGVQDTRRRVKLDELAQTKEQDTVAKVLKTLTDARLVTTEQDSAEVAHEALIREWGTLRKWLDEDRESLRTHRHLTESAGEWIRRGKEAGELYRGARLKQLQDWVKEHGDALSPLEREFVKASQNVKKRERRGWVALAGVGFMLLFGIVLLIGDWLTAGSSARNVLENRLSSAAESIAWSVPFFLEAGQNLAMQLASDPRLLESTGEELKSILGLQIKVFPYFDQILVLDVSNRNLLAGYPDSAEEDFRLFPEEVTGITLTSNGVLAQTYSIPPTSGDYAAQVSFLAAIVDSYGQVQRVLIGRTTLVTNPLLLPMLQTMENISEEGGTGFLLNENNRILYSSDHSQTLYTYNEPHGNEPFIYENIDANGTRELVYYQPVGGHPWAVVLMVPAPQVQQNTLNIALPLSAMIIFLAIVAMVSLRLSPRVEQQR